jgi:hypothetical protein
MTCDSGLVATPFEAAFSFEFFRTFPMTLAASVSYSRSLAFRSTSSSFFTVDLLLSPALFALR